MTAAEMDQMIVNIRTNSIDDLERSLAILAVQELLDFRPGQQRRLWQLTNAIRAQLRRARVRGFASDSSPTAEER